MGTERTAERRSRWGLAHFWVSTLSERQRDGDKEGGRWLAHYLEDCISVIKKKVYKNLPCQVESQKCAMQWKYPSGPTEGAELRWK